MKEWSLKQIEQLDEKLKDVKQRDLRFFRVEEFKRNIKRVNDFSESCSECKKEKLNINDIVQKIEEAIEVPGKSRREYDRIMGRISAHMQKEHGFYPPFYFSYLFSFFGMVAGILTGYLLMKLFPQIDWVMLISGFVAGLFAGYFYGNRKDKQVREQKKLM